MNMELYEKKNQGLLNILKTCYKKTMIKDYDI